MAEGLHETSEPWRIRAVDDFLSSYGNVRCPDIDPHRYPGERPDTSYLTDGVHIMPIDLGGQGEFNVITPEATADLNDWLSAQRVGTMEERIPVLAYGSNLCPATLAKKFTFTDRPDLKIVPTLYGWMGGIEVVWHERPSQRGAYFAELYAGDEVADTEVQVGINFLTPEQLLIMHRGEQTYDFGRFSEVQLAEGTKLPALMYAGSGRVMLKDGRPIAMPGVRRRRGVLPVIDSRSVMGYQFDFDLFRDTAAETLGLEPDEITPEIFTEKMLGMTVAEKRPVLDALTMAVRSIDGLSSAYSMSKKVDHTFSWANPSTIPTYGDIKEGKITTDNLIRLPAQELPKQGLSEQGLKERDVVLSAINKHWHRRNSQ